jgi:copper resistance protein C
MCWWCVVGAVPAQAHTELQSSSPAQGAVLDAAPETVRLTFTEELAGGSLAVTASGRSVGVGPARVDGADLVLDIAAGSPGGAWTAAYRVVSADGHPVTGEFAFTVQPDRASDTATPSPSAAATTAATESPNGHGGTHPASGRAHPSPVVEVVVTVLAMAALVVGVFVRRRGD